jgi:hypothetical protein
MTRSLWLAAGVAALVVAAGCGPGGADQAASVQAASTETGSGVPNFAPDPLFFRNLPNRWTTGAVGGIAVDENDHVWILHRPASIGDTQKTAATDPPQALCCAPAPPVIEYDENGNYVRAWGGPGPGYDWPATEHGITVDYRGNVWIAGNGMGDHHALKFTKEGKFLLQIGRKGQSKGSNDTENLNGTAAIFVYAKTNEAFVADGYTNRRVIVLDADTGRYKRHWGAYGKPPDDTIPLPPRQQIVQGPPQPSFGNPVHAVIVSNDDLVYVGDRSNNRIQVFRLDGTFVREVFVNRNTLQNEGTVHNFALSRDPAQRYLYVADGSNKAIHILDRATLTLLDSIGGHGGHNAREFYHLHSLAATPDSRGHLYIGEVNVGQRFYRYVFTGMGPPQNPGYSTVTTN